MTINEGIQAGVSSEKEAMQRDEEVRSAGARRMREDDARTRTRTRRKTRERQ